MKQETFDLMKHSVRQEKKALELLEPNMDRAVWEKTLDWLKNSPLTVTSACGSSGFAAKKFAHSLCCVERPAKFVSPSEAVHGGMGALPRGGVLVLVTKGGKTDELLPLIPIARKKQARLIVVTACPDAPVAAAADAVLLLPDLPESDQYNMMSTASFAATTAIFDALMVGLMEETGYTPEDFALIHPGGAVGKRIG